MSTAFLLLYDDSLGSDEEVRGLIDSCAEIEDWYRCLPNSFFITSAKSATELAQVILNRTGQEGRFLLLDMNTDRDGWLPKPVWDILNRSRTARRLPT